MTAEYRFQFKTDIRELALADRKKEKNYVIESQINNFL